MKTVEEVQRMLGEARAGAATRIMPQADRDYAMASVEALTEQFVGACLTQAYGEPDRLEVVYKEHQAKATFIVTMIVELLNEIPSGNGLLMTDAMLKIAKAIDE
jgi:hypothetical protein